MDRTDLPIEAVKINDRYIEDILPGYTTIITSGREGLPVEINAYSVGAADGEMLKSSRYPSRTIKVNFALHGDNLEDLRKKLTQLNNLLACDETDFIFNDEADKYYTGKPVMENTFNDYKNAVTGTWSIRCMYPFKRSVNVRTLSSDDQSGVVVGDYDATFTFQYKGTRPARPILRAKFAGALDGGDYGEDGDCGFVAFLDADENIIQLGNPEAVDLDPLNKNETLINSAFDSLTGWTASGITVGPITDQYWNEGAGQTQNYAGGTGTLSRSTSGAVNFNLDMVHRLAVLNASETGSFKCLLKNGNVTVVGFTITKSGNGTNATVEYIINNKTVRKDTIDISYYNTNFGYCKRDPVYVEEVIDDRTYTYRRPWERERYWDRWARRHGIRGRQQTRTVQTGWSYTQSSLNTSIVRNGATVTFNIGRLASRTFKRSAIADTLCYDVVLETTGSFNTNAVRSLSFVRKAGVAFADIPNVFTADDVVEADCNSADVYLYRKGSLDGHLEPQYGALGNDWETFQIKPGTNIIRAVWSDWVDTDYKPTIEIAFNEVYL